MLTSDNIPEAIRLQLRKPKSWRWELSTSKSSPHIVLPVIQLYDYKGQLLVETTADYGDAERKTWQSSACQLTDRNNVSVRRTRSATLDHDSPKGPLKKTTSTSTLTNLQDKNIQRNFSAGKNRGDSKGKPTDIDGQPSERQTAFPQRNVTDEDVGGNNGSVPNGAEECQSVKGSSLTHDVSAETLSKKMVRNDENLRGSCKRSKSDDLYKRKLRYFNSSEESLKRAEIDGYRKFITAHMAEDEQQQKPAKGKHKGVEKNGKETAKPEIDRRLIEMTHMKPKKYTTRTSSAGTLVIPEESFRDVHNKRIRMTRIAEENDADRPCCASECRNHRRQASDPIAAPKKSIGRNRSDCEDLLKGTDRLEKQRHPYSITGLFYSQSDVFPMKKLLNGREFDENHNRVDVSESDDWNFKAIREKSARRRRKRRIRKVADKEGHLIKDHSAQCSKESGGSTALDPPEASHDSEVGPGDLLRLVRRLSLSTPASGHAPEPGPAPISNPAPTPEHASGPGSAPNALDMGANVSRHSAKGLSGRRSHSSGSICNGGGSGGGKGGGRHPEGKICSSLPSYLDDGEKGQNEGDHQQKVAVDEVDRLSTLGDGAPFHWKFSEGAGHPLCDQGYGSERSPEDEYPPPLPNHDRLHTCHRHLEPHQCYPFITPESTFTVKLSKGSRGLGLSVTGGIDGGGPWPGLVRVKRLFPHQPASACGLLSVGDLLLEVNGDPLTGLTNYEALEVLRTATNQVNLKVCRPPPDVLNCVSPISEVPPPPPRREPPNSLNLPMNIYNTPEDEYYHGEFEITLTKIQGSLGFTLRKEDDSALGHYVRALLREPALTDGRIRAGDKIVAVNDAELCPMTHEQAVQFLRRCPDVVKLRLYRDAAQTPVATLSPSETTPRNSFSRKPNLRQEAVDMLNDIAGRKLVDAHHESGDQSPSPDSSLRRPRRPPRPPDAAPRCERDHFHEQFHEALLQQCSQLPFDDAAFDSLFTSEPEDEGGDRPPRPASLDLYNPNQTPVACRKPRFNFSLAHNAYELNNLDAEVLDAPNLTYNLGNEDIITEQAVQEPVSMPHIPTNNATFSYKNPAYQSAHPQMGSEPLEPAKAPSKVAEDGTLKRRKSSVAREERSRQMPIKEEYEVLAIELNRGWNSRLGFSLQGAAGVTYVSAVHADSVAAKDGRLKPGDRLIKVNDESIEHMTTSEIIELLRIVRGPVCIVISRVKSNE